MTYLFKYRYTISSEKLLGKIVIYLGSCVFSGYLFEEFFRIKYLTIYDKMSGYLHPFLIFPIYAIAIFISTVIVSSILKVIPVVKTLRL